MTYDNKTKETSVKASKSFSTLQSNPSSKESKFKKVNGFFQKAGIEWNLFVLKLKSIKEDVFSVDEVIGDLFVESESDSIMDRLDKVTKGYSMNEERFLADFKKFKNLDKIHDHYQQKNITEEMKSSSTVCSDSNRIALKDLLQVNSASSTPIIFSRNDDEFDESGDDDDDDNNNNNNNNNNNTNTNTNNDDDNDNTIINNYNNTNNNNNTNNTNDDDDDSTKNSLVLYQDIDVCKLREQIRVDGSTNIGEALWEYRRTKWLLSSYGKDNQPVSTSKSIFDQIPKDSYVKIYNNLVDKGRPLKADRLINLHDLMKVINAGWVAEEKWERAAIGLP